ncbi:MAG: hypothetical protein FWJ83_06335 [Limnochordales bacterium]
MERTNKREKLVIGAALGECVHVAGVVNFLRLADEQGYKTVSLGPAVSVRELVGAIVESDPELVAVGYRLTPSTAEPLFAELKRELERAGVSRVRLVFGGTAPVAEVAARSGLFEHVFNGEESIEDVVAYLKGHKVDRSEESYPQTLVERIQWKAPFPIIRHHFGLPSLEETIEGARQIAEARVLDVLSIGTDQAAQESFFRPEELARHKAGAGGVPVRKPEDLRAIFEATRTGNYPLLRCYSGTRDQLKWAEMLVDTINNAWAAIPLTWYSVLDGRSQRPLLQTIRETQEAFKWHGDRGIPVESNESHHWSLRDAPDVVAVVMAFLAAYNARKMGVKDYVAQYMFNNPPATSPRMDLAKMLAKKELIAELRGPDFEVWTETRAGLSSYPTDLDEAKGHLAFSTALQMALKPHIVHVVAFTEAQHAARAHEVIESVKIARRVIEKVIHDFPDLADDERVQQRKEVLKKEAGVLLDAIKRLGESRGAEDPWGDPETLTAAVEMGLLDAPHLRNNPAAKGTVVTQIVDGACVAVDPETKRPLTEEERIARLMAEEAAGRAV